uniref:Uncharacterized protein n=1 Tax=Glossina morsitans morsitans TaxID=37546 RepID=A0A1B0FBU6_GLOMM
MFVCPYIDIPNLGSGLPPIEGPAGVPPIELLSKELVAWASPNPIVDDKDRGLPRDLALHKDKDFMMFALQGLGCDSAQSLPPYNNTLKLYDYEAVGQYIEKHNFVYPGVEDRIVILNKDSNSSGNNGPKTLLLPVLVFASYIILN